MLYNILRKLDNMRKSSTCIQLGECVNNHRHAQASIMLPRAKRVTCTPALIECLHFKEGNEGGRQIQSA